MMDGKLAEDGKVTPNIKVVILGAEPNTEFLLEDEGGRFLGVPAVTLLCPHQEEVFTVVRILCDCQQHGHAGGRPYQ